MAKGIAAAVVILRSGYKNEKGSGRVMKPVYTVVLYGYSTRTVAVDLHYEVDL